MSTLDSRTLVNCLLPLFGKVLVAYVANSTSIGAVERWASGDALPSQAETERLAVAHEVVSDVSKADDPQTAVLWFLALNVQARDKSDNENVTAAQAIHEGRFDAARVAAQRFITDSVY